METYNDRLRIAWCVLVMFFAWLPSYFLYWLFGGITGFFEKLVRRLNKKMTGKEFT